MALPLVKQAGFFGSLLGTGRKAVAKEVPAIASAEKVPTETFGTRAGKFVRRLSGAGEGEQVSTLNQNIAKRKDELAKMRESGAAAADVAAHSKDVAGLQAKVEKIKARQQQEAYAATKAKAGELWSKHKNKALGAGAAYAGYKTLVAPAMQASENRSNAGLMPWQNPMGKMGSALLGDQYEVKTAADLKAADAYFSRYFTEFTPIERREYATNLAKLASANGFPVSEAVTRYSADAINSEIDSEIELRSYLVGDQDALIIQEAVKLASAQGPDVLVETLTALDETYNLDRHWGTLLADPAQAVYAEKVASKWCGVANKLLTKHASLMTEKFGDHFLDELQTNPDVVLESLPRPVQEFLESLAE